MLVKVLNIIIIFDYICWLSANINKLTSKWVKLTISVNAIKHSIAILNPNNNIFLKIFLTITRFDRRVIFLFVLYCYYTRLFINVENNNLLSSICYWSFIKRVICTSIVWTTLKNSCYTNETNSIQHPRWIFTMCAWWRSIITLISFKLITL